MKAKFKVAAFVLLAILVITCKKKEAGHSKESINSGKVTILVDETLTPIIEDQVQIFESTYDAKITLESKSEAEVIQKLANDTSQIAVLSRGLNPNEEQIFKNKKIIPRITKIATDAIALISNKNDKDTIIALQDIIAFMQQKPSSIKGLVFDNPNSSTARYINELAGIKSFPEKGVFSFKTNDEVIKYVSENSGIIGVVGMNWINDPKPETQPYLEKINVLSVKGNSSNSYTFPSQNNIAEGIYPLARDLYIVNCQGYAGLGMGFSSFVTSETGQRIILKAGLVPVKTPSRQILIRNGKETNKK
ncbi:phosphate ABC transporter substrate-binding protein [Flavobacterium noncentrifugens]|uniref:Phosphate transport system substrate-binding protein n=1 Tax=Flavobacterium noncentrifugens TaxID=1128970 RepID=A0A1G9B6I3_9FLAO|nr:substrate-binding domain-containing protein [Flavobacterium noncentrifugens]GEP51704.1 phosphate ABC transporter substrate-binding protein [Flavobacterium noncentrifugens]SDK34485.1 phosphate transport system substrate-binding protein [Flavobacterium noncentrifugens]